MASHEFDQFLKKNSRFYLHAARTHALDEILGSTELIEVLEKEYTPFKAELAETPLAPWLGPDAATVYRQWTEDDSEVVTLSQRASDFDLNALLDEAAWTNDLVGDSVTFLQDMQRVDDPDDAGLILVGLNIKILEQKWDHLTDAFIINVAHDLRSTYDIFVDQVSTRRGKSFSSADLSREIVFRLNAQVFIAETFHRALMTALNGFLMFHVPNKALHPRVQFENLETGKLREEFYQPPFLEEQLGKMDQVEKLMNEMFPKIAARFSPDLWEEAGEPGVLPLLLAQLWDDRGLLSRVAYQELYQMCRGEGALLGKAKKLLDQARRWTGGLSKIHKLTAIAAEVERISQECLALSFDTVPDNPQGTLAKLADYERLIDEKEKSIAARIEELHMEVGKLGIDYSNILDPTIEELIRCLPDGESLSVASARGLVHLAHKGGIFYAPLKRHSQVVRRECRYLKKLFPFHQETVAACQAEIAKRNYRAAAELYTEIDRKFPDIDYGPVEAGLGDWRRMEKDYSDYRESFATLEKDLSVPDLHAMQLAALRESLVQWDAFISGQRETAVKEIENDYGKMVGAFVEEIDPRLRALQQQFGS